MRVLGHFGASTISDDVFQQLSFAFPDGPVCPGLQHLTWMSLCGWGARATLHPTSTGLSHFPPTPGAPIRNHRSNTRFRNFSSPNVTPGSTPPRRCHPALHLHSLCSLRSRSTAEQLLSTNSTLSDAAWAHLASLLKLESLWVSGTPSRRDLEVDTPQTDLPYPRVYQGGGG